MADRSGAKREEAKRYEALGRMLAELDASGVRPAKGYYRAAFLRGIVAGFGGVIGATLLVALLLWILSLFNSLPIIGGFIDTIRTTLNQK